MMPVTVQERLRESSGFCDEMPGASKVMEANTGKALWRFPTVDPVLSSPTVANGVVYVGSDDD